MNHSKKALQKKNGFILLFAVLITSIILAMALGIANVAFKESIFSAQARDSDIAFFAADTALECALYNDRTISPSVFFDDSTLTPWPIPSIDCLGGGVSNLVTPLVTVDPDYPGSSPQVLLFDFDPAGIPNAGITVGKGCAHLVVRKNLPNPNGGNPGTSIESKGYNANCSNKASMEKSGRLVERALRAVYYPI